MKKTRLTATLLSTILTTCGGSGARTPTTPPTPSPTPAPAPTPSPSPAGCPFGPGAGASNVRCLETSPSFLNEVDTAINQLVAQRPELFDFVNSRGDGGFLVRNPAQFFAGVVRNLNAMPNTCAIVDGGGEIAVKGDNTLSDQYHILISTDHIRRGPTSYRATCFPAWF